MIKKMAILLTSIGCLSLVSIAKASSYADVPTFSGNSSTSIIKSNKSFSSAINDGEINLGGENINSTANLAIVDNIEQPNCVVILQYADGFDEVNQSLAANNIIVNCN